jgi:hypothetical protein
MSYTLYKTNGSKLLVIQDGMVDSTTEMSYVGKNYTGYGTSVNENFLKLLENFANTTSPVGAITGQLWYDTSESRLKLYDGNKFKSLGIVDYGSTKPARYVAGDLHVDPDGSLFSYNGSAWTKIGPINLSSSVLNGGISTSIVFDQAQTSHYVVKLPVNGTTSTVISNDSLFLTGSNQDVSASFAAIYPGINLPMTNSVGISASSRVSGHLLWGTAASSLGLVNPGGTTLTTASDLVKSIDIQAGLPYSVFTQSPFGYYVANNSSQKVLQLHVTSGNIGNISALTGPTLKLNVNSIDGTYTNVISIDGTSNILKILPTNSHSVSLGSSDTGRSFSYAYVNTVTSKTISATNTITAATVVATSIKMGSYSVWNTNSLANVSTLANDAGYVTTATVGGVRSIAGTANQVSVSTSTGNVTISLPSSVTINNTLTVANVTASGAIYASGQVYSQGKPVLTTLPPIPSGGIQIINPVSAQTTVTVINSTTVSVGLASDISGLNSLNASALYSGSKVVLTTSTVFGNGVNLSYKYVSTNSTFVTTGTLSALNGGTGISSYNIGDLLYGSGSSALGKLAAVSTGSVLVSNGVNTAPSWDNVDLTNSVKNILAVTNGGLGQSSFTNNTLIYYTGTNMASMPTGTAGQYLKSTGSGAPAWGNIVSADVTSSLGYTPLHNVTPGYTGSSVYVSTSSPYSSGGTVGDIWLDISGATGYSQNLSSAGWTVLPNGLILQWGSITYPTAHTYSFPIAFNTALQIFVTNTNSQGDQVDNAYGYIASSSTFYVATKSSAGAGVTAFGVAWFAIGY